MDESISRIESIRLRQLLNELKHNESTAASVLGIRQEILESVLDGKTGIDAKLLSLILQKLPINRRDLYPVENDCKNGFVLCRASDSKSNSRILFRDEQPYYEYRDTAMTRLCEIRPEWIKMLMSVENDDPLNSTIKYNNGHFFYQLSYFLGDVNFYFANGDTKICKAMSVGDTVFSMPFVPHSFAARNNADRGIIIAVTFPGKVCESIDRILKNYSQDELHRIVDRMSEEKGQLLRQTLENSCLSVSQLSEESGIPKSRLRSILNGGAPSLEECISIDRASGNMSMSMSWFDSGKNATVIKHCNEAETWIYPDNQNPRYRIARGVRTPWYVGASCFEVIPVSSKSDEAAVFETTAFEYVYNVGSAPVNFTVFGKCEQQELIIEPNDSIICLPFCRHAFSIKEHSDVTEDGRLFVVRVPFELASEQRAELFSIGMNAIEKRINESGLWYD